LLGARLRFPGTQYCINVSMEAADNLRSLTEYDCLRLGLATGTIEQFMSQPFLYWKNSYQQGLTPWFSLNPRIAYRGTLASIVNSGLGTAFQFTFAGQFQKLLTRGEGQHMSYSQELGAAFLGGAASGPMVSITELTMIQQQRFGGTLFSTPIRLVRTHGLVVLTRGCLVTCGKEACFTTGYLGIMPVAHKYLDEHYDLSPWACNFVGAFGGGQVCAFISQPLDTAKSCMQGDVERKKYDTFLQTLRTLTKEYGSVRAIWRGYMLRSMYATVKFSLLDVLRQRLAPVMFPTKCGNSR